MKTGIFAFEDLEQPTPMSAADLAALDEQLAADTAGADEAANSIIETAEEIDHAERVSATVSSIGEAVASAGPDGLSAPVAHALDTALEHLYASVQYRKTRVSLESMSASGGYTHALEGIKEFGKKVWNAIIAALKKIGEYIQKFIGFITGSTKSLEKKAVEVKKEISEIKREHSSSEIREAEKVITEVNETAGLFKKSIVDTAPPPPPAVAKVKHSPTYIHSRELASFFTGCDSTKAILQKLDDFQNLRDGAIVLCENYAKELRYLIQHDFTLNKRNDTTRVFNSLMYTFVRRKGAELFSHQLSRIVENQSPGKTIHAEGYLDVPFGFSFLLKLGGGSNTATLTRTERSSDNDAATNIVSIANFELTSAFLDSLELGSNNSIHKTLSLLNDVLEEYTKYLIGDESKFTRVQADTIPSGSEPVADTDNKRNAYSIAKGNLQFLVMLLLSFIRINASISNAIYDWHSKSAEVLKEHL